jgi:5'(3')-deoxyribonucleotidase
MARRHLDIAVDLDGIVSDLHSRWLELYNYDYGLSVGLEDLKHWDMQKNVSRDHDIYKYLGYEGLYLHLDPLTGACESLFKLHEEGHRIHIISAPSKDEQTAADKLTWCSKHLPFIRRQFLTLSHQKHRFLSDVFVDDSPNNIRDHAREQPTAVRLGIAWPYNYDVKNLMHLRAESYRDTKTAWGEMVDFIDKVSRRVS